MAHCQYDSSLNAIAKHISNADVVFLQEVDKNTIRSGLTINQLKCYQKNQDYLIIFLERHLIFFPGEYGIAILSRYPLYNSQNYLIPLISSDHEKTNIIESKIIVQNVPIRIICGHFNHQV